jgi:CubicO group peptidase (beta-lactamase class C family)
VDAQAPGVVLTPPEGDAHVVLVEPARAADATASLAAARHAYKFKAPWVPRLVTPQPGRNGWDSATQFEYELPPNAHESAEAIAWRHGARWTVAMIEGSDATLERRHAAVALILQSVRPAGSKAESFAGRTAHVLDAARLAALSDFVRRGMDQLGIPGVGLAVIDHGRVVFEGGLGHRRLGTPLPVDAHTRFMIASNTKSMTTLLLARLVDEGKLRWDEKVTDAYPGFRLGNDATTRQVLVRHLVCACTGVPRNDLLWFFTATRATPPEDTFAQLAALQPTSSFGEVFQYNNYMAAAAGFVAGHVAYPGLDLGAAYDRAMTEDIFRPLGMFDTTFDTDAALASDHADPHADDIDGHAAPASMDINRLASVDRPGGGAWSSAHDMILYVNNELTAGKLPDGKQVVSAKNLLARRIPGVQRGKNDFYGMGLIIDRHWGVQVIHHGGSLIGFKSDFVVLPEAAIGAVLLTNADNGVLLLKPFMRKLLEILYDGRPEADGDVAAAAAEMRADSAKTRKTLVLPPAVQAVALLAPAYTSPDLGHFTVRHTDDRVIFDFGAWHSEIASRTNEDGTVSFVTIDPGEDGFAFTAGTKAGMKILTIEDGQHSYTYTGAS